MASPELLTGLGAAFSTFFASAGSAIASAHAGVYAVRGQGIKSFFPIIIAGVLAIYGIIISVILSSKLPLTLSSGLSSVDGYKNLSAGLSVGLACLASGVGMAQFLQSCNNYPHSSSFPVGVSAQQQQHQSSLTDAGILMTEPLLVAPGRQLFVPTRPEPSMRFLMVLVFLEAIGLYGLIMALLLMSK
jgi:ATP synthase proteolipid subunit